MKAITIWQPYATLIMLGAKRFETRSWPTTYRGPLVIHAAKRWDEYRALDCLAVKRYLQNSDFDESKLTEEQWRLSLLPWEDTIGRALGVVDLVNCSQMNSGGTVLENQVGSFGPERFGWECQRPKCFPQPIYHPGKQGLWYPEVHLQKSVANLLGEVHANESA
ncbi:MAG: ASCH domain-containing protein [Planctomyces sp.]|nr:ASCH domain-containing protein [Planctomyces sp.]